MGSILSSCYSIISREEQLTRYSLIVSSVAITISAILISAFFSPLQWRLKRFLRIQIRKRIIDPVYQGTKENTFATIYRTSLCHLQTTNDDLLAEILQQNYPSAFSVDRCISFLPSGRPSSVRSGDMAYASINDFRAKVPLTTYEDYREYIDGMVVHGKKNQLSPTKIIYFATSSGTTGSIKYLPIHATMMQEVRTLMRCSSAVTWSSLRSPYPSPQRRAFQLYCGRKAAMFPKAKDGTPIGPISEFFSAVSMTPSIRFLMSTFNILSFDLIESISAFETTIFVQLVFALAIPDLFSYTVTFAPVLLHTIQIIETYFEEISDCIATASFDRSSLVREHIGQPKVRTKLNQALKEVTLEYGGPFYQNERAKSISDECTKQGVPELLHRLWPTLAFVSTTTGSSFAMYKEKIQFYCGPRLPLVNMMVYAASEGFFGFLAGVDTDEYILSPTVAFFEFIKEEDMHEAQPKTLLLSEIEPGNRYELVCTTRAGLIRYRMGDVLSCTRFLCRADDLVPLPMEPVPIPRIPLVSIAYRAGSLLNVIGEKTTEQHVMHALEAAAQQWREGGEKVQISDFTAYPKLDVFPPKYVIFLELKAEQGSQIEQNDQFQQHAHVELDRQLSSANPIYGSTRSGGKLSALDCVLVRDGTFSTFLHKELVTDRVNPAQIKPHRLLKNKHHIDYFYNNSVSTALLR